MSCQAGEAESVDIEVGETVKTGSLVRELGSARCIPFMQLALALAADLDLSDGRDEATLGSLLTALLEELGVGEGENPGQDGGGNTSEMSQQTPGS